MAANAENEKKRADRQHVAASNLKHYVATALGNIKAGGLPLAADAARELQQAADALAAFLKGPA